MGASSVTHACTRAEGAGPPLAISSCSAPQSPPWGGDRHQVTPQPPPPGGGGDCKGISRQTVVPSTDAGKQITGEVTLVMQPPQPGALRVEHSDDPLE